VAATVEGAADGGNEFVEPDHTIAICVAGFAG
jgi:hypothetical protein